MDLDHKLIVRWERDHKRTYRYDGLSEDEDDVDDCNVEDSDAAALGPADMQSNSPFSGGSFTGASSSVSYGGSSSQPPVPVLAIHRMGGGLHCPMESAPLAHAAPVEGPSSPVRQVRSTAVAGAEGEASVDSQQLGFGYDLDEDVERIVAAEEAGLSFAAAGIPEHYASTLNNDGASSSSSELIAAGRHIEEAEEEHGEGELLQPWGSGGSDGLLAGRQAGDMFRGSFNDPSSSSVDSHVPVTPIEER
jgi:hypothetical protein